MRRLVRTLRRLFRDAAGVSAVEFAVMTPVLALAIVGIADFGLAINAKLTLEKEVNAAQLVALQAMDDTAVVQTYIDNTMKPYLLDKGFVFDGDDISTVSTFCACPDKSAVSNLAAESVACNSSCVFGGATVAAYRYFRIDVTARYPLPFTFGALQDVSFAITRNVQVNGG